METLTVVPGNPESPEGAWRHERRSQATPHPRVWRRILRHMRSPIIAVSPRDDSSGASSGPFVYPLGVSVRLSTSKETSGKHRPLF